MAPQAGAIQAGAAFVAISADDSPLVKGLRGASSKVGRFAKRLGKVGASVGRVFRRVGAAIAGIGRQMLIAGAAAAVAGAAIVRSFAVAGDRLAKTADKLGITVEALNELGFAAERGGVDVNTFSLGLQRFIRRSAEAANGTGEAKDALKQLGIQLTDTTGNLRPAEELFGDVADAFEKVQNPAEKLRLAFKLFDSEGVALINVMRGGRKALNAFREEARRLNPVTEEQARLAEKITDLFTNLREALKGVRNAFVTALGPAITKILEDMTEAVVDFRIESISSLGEVVIFFDTLITRARQFSLVMIEGFTKIKDVANLLGGELERLTGITFDISQLPTGNLSKETLAKIKQLEEELEARAKLIRAGRFAAAEGKTRAGRRGGGPSTERAPAKDAAASGFGIFATRLLGQILPKQGNPLVALGEKQIAVQKMIVAAIKKLSDQVGPRTGGEFNIIAALVSRARSLPADVARKLIDQLLGLQAQFAEQGPRRVSRRGRRPDLEAIITPGQASLRRRGVESPFVPTLGGEPRAGTAVIRQGGGTVQVLIGQLDKLIGINQKILKQAKEDEEVTVSG